MVTVRRSDEYPLLEEEEPIILDETDLQDFLSDDKFLKIMEAYDNEEDLYEDGRLVIDMDDDVLPQQEQHYVSEMDLSRQRFDASGIICSFLSVSVVLSDSIVNLNLESCTIDTSSGSTIEKELLALPLVRLPSLVNLNVANTIPKATQRVSTKWWEGVSSADWPRITSIKADGIPMRIQDARILTERKKLAPPLEFISAKGGATHQMNVCIHKELSKISNNVRVGQNWKAILECMSALLYDGIENIDFLPKLPNTPRCVDVSSSTTNTADVEEEVIKILDEKIIFDSALFYQIVLSDLFLLPRLSVATWLMNAVFYYYSTNDQTAASKALVKLLGWGKEKDISDACRSFIGKLLWTIYERDSNIMYVCLTKLENIACKRLMTCAPKCLCLRCCPESKLPDEGLKRNKVYPLSTVWAVSVFCQ